MTAPASAQGPGKILWLASYPKSGNTWLRVMLTNYCHPNCHPASINELIGGRIANERQCFDHFLGLASSDLTPAETLRLRPLFHRLLAEEFPRPTFVKTHHAYVRATDGAALFPREASAGAVYVVRNPLDVAVSFAHHENRKVGWAITQMNDPGAVLGQRADGLHGVLPDALLSWSGHVASWLDQDAIPVHLVRYEDIHAHPVAALAGVARFAGFAPDAARLRQAVDHAAFPGLRAQEAAVGFDERQPTARSFFRAGVVGGWRDGLSPHQARKLTTAHGSIMARLGYLDDVTQALRSLT